MSKQHLRQNQVESFFNPEDMTRWAKIDPIVALANTLPEIMTCAITIDRWATVICEHPDVDESSITFSEDTTLKDMVEEMKMEASLLARIVRTMAVYRRQYRIANGLLDDIEPGE